VYAFLGTANLFALLVRPFCTPFQLVWGVRASNMDLQNYGLFTRITYWLEAKLSRFADLIICNSVAGRSHAVQKGFPADRAVVVPNGIDTDRFRPDPELRARARATWGIGPEEVAVGILARLDPIKDHSTFLRAAQIVIAQVPNARFICIGDGPADYAAELRALGEELGIGRGLIWAGNTNNSVMSLNGLDVLCSSSTGEGFPNSILEGMACGKPCVVTDVGDSRLIIGDAGVSVPPRNPAALAQALVEVLKAGPSVVAGEARARVIAHFSIDRMVEATIGHLRPSLERST
jgi:glycosyltransferase involved in cell wall biosynthesis